MCGIAGVFDVVRGGGVTENCLVRMAETITRRGPDGSGTWIDPSGQVGFAHRRLAIVGLGTAGRQPMTSASGRFTITFNGEIYNYRALARELVARGHSDCGSGDTATMLAAFEEWGIRSALDRFVGMYAFAVWDARERKLSLARDRLGKKPLFLSEQGGRILFGSQLTTLLAVEDAGFSLDRSALAEMVEYGAVSGTRTVLHEVRRVAPGTLLSFGTDGTSSCVTCWTARLADATSSPMSAALTAEEFVNATEQLVRDAVRDRMVAEVPLGAFLSGGIDSAVVTALMQQESGAPVRTYTVGFRASGYDEAPAAEQVASALGTDHHTFYVEESDALQAVIELPHAFDEPFADASALPMYLISSLARREVTVALSGDGGDEVFGGYNRHMIARRLWPRLAATPGLLRAGARGAIRSVPADTWDSIAALLRRASGSGASVSMLGLKLDKVARLLRHSDLGSAYVDMRRPWADLPGVVLHGRCPSMPAPVFSGHPDEQARQMMLEDLKTYLVDDVMVKVDRATMAHGLEARAPLLDHRLVDWMLSAPTHLVFPDSASKPVLRRIAARLLPPFVLQRPKAGFASPIEHWLRGPFRPWVLESFGEPLRAQGVFDPVAVDRIVDDHMSGRRQLHYPVWALLMAQRWLMEHGSRIKLS